MNLLILVLVTGTLAVSCAKEKADHSSSADREAAETAEDAPIKSDTDGVVVASLNGAKAQRINASASSGLAGATITFPSGALGRAVDVTIQEGTALDIAAAKAELHVDSDLSIVAATSTLIMTASEQIDMAKPARVTMPYPVTAGLLEGDLKPALLYQVVRQDQGGKTFVGIDAATKLVLAGGSVTFSVAYFGAYTVVLVPASYTEVKGVPTTRPIPSGKTEPAKDQNETGSGGLLAVTTHTPAEGIIARPASVSLTFDKNIQAASAANGIAITPSGGTAVDGTTSVNGPTVTFTPARGFVLGGTYEILAKKATLRGAGGESLAADTAFHFTVADGKWGVLPVLGGMPQNPNGAKIVALNNGKFGAALRIGPTSPTTKISIWNGTAWGAVVAKDYSANLQQSSFAGGPDGRLYIMAITGFPYAFRMEPPLPAELSMAAPGAYYMNMIAPLQPGKAAFAYMNNADHSITARVLAGDTLGAAEVVAPAAANRVIVDLVANSQGVAALAQSEQIDNIWHMKVVKRTAEGAWASLNPAGSDVVANSELPPAHISLDVAGKVAAFWCVSGACAARVYDGSAWGAPVALTLAGPMSSYFVHAFANNGIDERAVAVIDREFSGAHYLEVAVFEKGQWSTAQDLDSNNSTFYKVSVGMDDAGRAHVIWIKGDEIRTARFTENGWSTPTAIVTSGVSDSGGFSGAIDPSGEAMAVWYQADGLHSVVFH